MMTQGAPPYLLTSPGNKCILNNPICYFAGADLSTRTQSGGNLLFHASWWGNVEAVRFLVMHGLDFEETNRKGDTPLVFVKNNPPGEDKAAFIDIVALREAQFKVIEFLETEAPKFKSEHEKFDQENKAVDEAAGEVEEEPQVMLSYCWAQQPIVKICLPIHL